MNFRAMTDQWPLGKGTAICIQQLDYEGGPHFSIQAGDLFPVFAAGQANQRSSAKVVMLHDERTAVLELDDRSRWIIKRIQRHGSFEIAAGASASFWEVAGPAA
jgi:hypothetical protein